MRIGVLERKAKPVGTAPRSEAYGDKRSAGAPAARSTAGGPFKIIKPGQGMHVRWGTAIGAGVLALAGAYFASEQLQAIDLGTENRNFYFHTLLPVVLLVVALYGIFWVVGRKAAVVDFLIATEGEMKKVSWSTRREVWGATKVVIVCVFALGIILALVDAFFMTVFGWMGVLKNVKIWQIFFGGDV
jgi:preprotein translocase subunit SecE